MTATEEIRRDFGFKDQIQRAAVSIMSNIAEGFERVSIGETGHLYSIARASCAETRSLLYLAEDLFNEHAENARRLRSDAIKVGKLISGLIRATSTRKE
jgi:four helix bundle protein